MKRSLLSLTAVLLTFAVGAACAISFRALTSGQPEISLEDPTAQINLADEAALRADLSQMRSLIDQYKVDRRDDPRSLDDLVRAGYLKELPIGPMTGKRDWQPEGLGCPSKYGFYFFYITDIHSRSEALSSDGTRYSEW